MASTTSPRWRTLPAGIGDMIRNARHRADLSRRALASAAHVSEGTVQSLEGGRRPPSVELAERLCAVLELDAWESAVLASVAVDPGQLRGRRGVRHVNRRGVPLPPEVYRRIADERTAGLSWRVIAERLNQDQVPTIQGCAWWSTSVRNAAKYQTEKEW
ncbi:helix-turn-helix domain-containing protein [Streptomyces fagopyri]|uniref:helix-turn-helix domain-containing protein n=1 Tax=Streptomyces fagopyri TaxID=2662397 RepID=UPI0037156854